MPAKAPIYLKAGNNKKGKKFKLRDILSTDMISPPLGDLRHTIHIGTEGQQDVFGDISFLHGNYELLPGNEGSSSSGDLGGSYDLSRANSICGSMFSDSPFPVLKNAISLPSVGGTQALTLPSLSPLAVHSRHSTFSGSKLPRRCRDPLVREKLKENCLHYENGTQDSDSSSIKSSCPTFCHVNGGVSSSSSLSEHCDWQTGDLSEDGHLSGEPAGKEGKCKESLTDLTDSLLSMQLDLGPSLLDEVLKVMDENKF